jgi:hypothetical protein
MGMFSHFCEILPMTRFSCMDRFDPAISAFFGTSIVMSARPLPRPIEARFKGKLTLAVTPFLGCLCFVCYIMLMHVLLIGVVVCLSNIRAIIAMLFLGCGCYVVTL